MQELCRYRISSYSFRGNYSFLNLEIQRSQYIRPKVTVHKGAETIQGRKLFKGWNYMRKYGICNVTRYFQRFKKILFCTSRISRDFPKRSKNKRKCYFFLILLTLFRTMIFYLYVLIVFDILLGKKMRSFEEKKKYSRQASRPGPRWNQKKIRSKYWTRIRVEIFLTSKGKKEWNMYFLTFPLPESQYFFPIWIICALILRRGIVPYFFVTVIVTVIMISAMFIF